MSDITFESMINAWWEYQKRMVFTAIPAIIVGVRDIEQGRVDVKPTINNVFSDFETDLEWPAILSVPLMFPSSSTSALTFPVKQGDTVLVVFSQKSMDVFKGGDGTPQPPADYRVFDKRDAVAIPGLWPFGMNKNNPTAHSLPHSTDDTVIVHNLGTDAECEVRLTSGGAIKINGIDTSINTPLDVASSVTVGTGATGSFTTPLGQIVTVTDGIITNII